MRRALTAVVVTVAVTVGLVSADAALRPAGARMVTADPGQAAKEAASAMSATDGSGSTSAWAVAAGIAAVLVIVAVVLWLLFRRGSIADRARTDVPTPTPTTPRKELRREVRR